MMKSLSLAFLGAIGFLALAAQEPLGIQTVEQDGYQAVEVETSLVRYRFTEQGGALESAYIHFRSYMGQVLDVVPGWQGTPPNLSLIPGVSLPFEVWTGDELADPGVYQTAVDQSSPDLVRLSLARSRGGLSVEKMFTVKSDSIYTMDVDIHLEGQGETVRIVLGYRPSGKDAPELVFLYDGKTYTNPLAPGSYSRFEGLGLVDDNAVYFLRLPQSSGFVPFLGASAQGQPVFGLEIQGLLGEARLQGTVYTGRNRYLLLEKAGLENVTQVSIFSRFLVWMMKFIEWLYRVTSNYGWAIILFTLVTRVVLYPLMRNQYRSMAKMQALAPKIKKLQEKYKDDRQTLQKQMMELYQKEGVNPMGGCLPLLLQFPILILLWWAIVYSAELIHLSPGFLWIPDLSQPDPYYILLILSTGAMLLQQWFTQRRTPSAGGAQIMGWIFPLIMALMFLSFPAALWLYWLFTTLLQIGQQWFVEQELARAGPRGVRKPDESPGD